MALFLHWIQPRSLGMMSQLDFIWWVMKNLILRPFYLFILVFPSNNLLGAKVEAALKRLVSHHSTKWRQPYYRMCRYVNSRVAITLVQTTHSCIYVLRAPTNQMSIQLTQWEDKIFLQIYCKPRGGYKNVKIYKIQEVRSNTSWEICELEITTPYRGLNSKTNEQYQ